MNAAPRAACDPDPAPLKWLVSRRDGDDSAAETRINIESAEIDLGDGLYMHEEIWVTAYDAAWDVEVRVGLREGRLVADSVHVWRNRFSPGPVTSQALREIPVATLVFYAVNGVFRRDTKGPAGETWGWSAWPTEPEGAYVAEHGLDDTTLRIVARIYKLAYLIGDGPTKKVETLLDQPRSTAGRWVAAARKAGHLSDAPGPGKAGS